MPKSKDHIDETSYPFMDADAWRAGRRAHCGREVPAERLLAYEVFKERFVREGPSSLLAVRCLRQQTPADALTMSWGCTGNGVSCRNTIRGCLRRESEAIPWLWQQLCK